jgi:ribosome-binding factor A
MNTYFIDVANFSLNKYGEELCGDNVEISNTEDGIIVVMSDGLGSGVKASILATLTSKIAVTMLKGGATIDETIDTIASTLPECHVRKLAYSTFTVLNIKNTGEVYMVEYDNPPTFFFRKNRPCNLLREERNINNKTIYETKFFMGENDTLTIVSDGAVHAGVGQLLNLGWQWEHINDFLKNLVAKEKTSENICRHLLEVCKNLYDDKPGDDTTVITVKLKKAQYIDIFTGPPKNKDDDDNMVKAIKNAKGKIVICGGTTANIVSTALAKPITIDLEYYDDEVPPMGYMDGIDLVTEGLLTLNKTRELLSNYLNERKNKLIPKIIEGNDGASKLCKILLEDVTHIHIWVGQAINPAHQNPLFPEDFNLKTKVVKELNIILKELGKIVELTYY